jgi:large subunit ribosomal protein L21
VYAVVSDRGRQTGLRVGDVVDLDWNGDWSQGDRVRFDQVLLVSNEGKVSVGRPTLSGASVEGEVLGHVKGDKLTVFRMKRRKNVRVKRGHRQGYTRVRITSIDA